MKPFLDALANCNCPTWTTIFRSGHEELDEKATPIQALQTVKGKSKTIDEEEALEASHFFKKKEKEGGEPAEEKKIEERLMKKVWSSGDDEGWCEETIEII